MVEESGERKTDEKVADERPTLVFDERVTRTFFFCILSLKCVNLEQELRVFVRYFAKILKV